MAEIEAEACLAFTAVCLRLAFVLVRFILTTAAFQTI